MLDVGSGNGYYGWRMLAAGAECERDGNVPIHPEDVLAKIDKVERQARYD